MIEEVKEVKYLGLVFTRMNALKRQVNENVKKANKLLGKVESGERKFC